MVNNIANVFAQVLVTLTLIFVFLFELWLFFKIVPTPGRVRELRTRADRKIAIAGILAGAIYGLTYRAFGAGFGIHGFSVMTGAFVFCVPLVMGFLTVYLVEQEYELGWMHWVTLPWASAALALGACFLLAWEGTICIILFLPSFALVSSVGGILGGLARRILVRSKGRTPFLLCANVTVLPLLVAAFEGSNPSDYRQVVNAVEINASAARIWDEVASVRAITTNEHHFYWANAIGFPRPVAAELTGSGVGAVRRASFEGHVVFTETVTAWHPGKTIAFSIRANTDSIPPTSLDEHVTIGGPFFDVLEGRYDIEEMHSGRSRVILSSRHRLSTNFNFYSGLWTDFIMSDIQNYILSIIKRRAEGREAL